MNTGIQITITAENGAEIYYTTNGDDPSAESAKYSAPFTLKAESSEASMSVKAIAVKGDEESDIAVIEYTNSAAQLDAQTLEVVKAGTVKATRAKTTSK